MKGFKLKMGVFSFFLSLIFSASTGLTAQTLMSGGTGTPGSSYGMSEKIQGLSTVDVSEAFELMKNEYRTAESQFSSTADDGGTAKVFRAVELDYYEAIAEGLKEGTGVAEMLIRAERLINVIEVRRGVSSSYDEVQLLDKTVQLLTD